MAEQFEPKSAIRLIFEYDEDGVRLVLEQPVEMAIADDDEARRERPSPGFFIDTRDAAESILSRTRVEGAFAGTREVFPENPGEPITRVDDPRPRGAFTVVVPASDVADHVALVQMSEPPETPEPPDAAALRPGAAPATRVVEVARFPLARRR